MSATLSRRTFLAGLAATAGACSSSPGAGVAARTSPLTIWYTGLIFFQQDKSATSPTLKVGLLAGHNNSHKTIIVAHRKTVDTAGSGVSAQQLVDWHPTNLGHTSEADLTYWEATSLRLNLSANEALNVNAPFGVFPLESLAKLPGEVTATNSQSLLTFTNGSFSGYQRAHPQCEHEKADFNMVTSFTDNNPVLTRKLVDTVQQRVQISDGSMLINGTTTVKFLPGDVRLWVMQLDRSTPGPTDPPPNPKEIKHSLHYYDLVAGHAGEKYYPRRDDTLPTGCYDVSPIYCTPGENA